jgi:hypothetical protein
MNQTFDSPTSNCVLVSNGFICEVLKTRTTESEMWNLFLLPTQPVQTVGRITDMGAQAVDPTDLAVVYVYQPAERWEDGK